LFKVVLDPGPDKLEKWILGPAPSKRSTGVTLAQPRRQLTAKLNHSIGWLPGASIVASLVETVSGIATQPIPFPKSLRRRNSHLRRHHHTCHRRQILQRINLFPAPTPSTVPPTRNSGRSDPTSAAIRSRSAAAKGFSSTRAPDPAAQPPHSPKPHPARPAPATASQCR
jgi:hypothetical protein